MFQRIAKRLRDEDKGFTLIELMVVVLIIGILIAIAIPTFLGARTRAQDRAAQSSARNAVTAAKALYTDNENYADASVANMAAAEPSLTFLGSAADSTGQNSVSVHSVVTSGTKAQEFYAAVLSNGGTCWYIRDSVIPGADGGTGWAKLANGSATCSGADAAAIADGVYGAADTPGQAV